MRNAILAGLALTTLWSCGGGGGTSASTSPTSSTNLQLTIGDAPVDDLSSFQVTATSAYLVRQDGTAGAELLPEPRSLDLLDLRTKSGLLRTAALAEGTYTEFVLELDPQSVEARDEAGNVVPVTVTTGTAQADLVPALVLRTGQIARLHIDVDLEASLSGEVATGLTFAPVIALSRRTGSAEPIDEIYGEILSTTPSERRLSAELLTRLRRVSLGRIEIELADEVMLFDDDGEIFASERAFFAAAVAGTHLEAHGMLRGDGVFVADAIELDDDDGSVARIKGLIVDLDQGAAELTMRIREIKEGGAAVRRVLSTLRNPREIRVSFARARILIRGLRPRMGSAQDLRVGQEIDARFAEFRTEPFAARSIQIEDLQAEFEGTIVDTDDLPESFVIRLQRYDPSLRSLSSSSTNVRVRLDGSEPIYLKLSHKPEVGVAGLFEGLRVRVRGEADSRASTPTVDADDVRVRAGRLEGYIVSGNAARMTLLIEIDDIDDPFGTRLPNPVSAMIARGAKVRAHAKSPAELFRLLESAGRGEEIEVRVYGIADGAGGIIAHDLKVKAEKGK